MNYNPPAANCELCPRLCEFRAANQQQYPQFFNGAVPSFGDLSAEILIIGLAPGLKGANATGRPFTGDYAGDVLYEALAECGQSRGHYAARADDGFTLPNVRITNAVRCVPPENKPLPAETRQCNGFLRAEIAAMPNLRSILCLGQTSFNATLKALQLPLKAHPFKHGGGYLVQVSGSRFQVPGSGFQVSGYGFQGSGDGSEAGSSSPPEGERRFASVTQRISWGAIAALKNPPTGLQGQTQLPRKGGAAASGNSNNHQQDKKITITASYHTSRYNINTGRLTREMFLDVLKQVLSGGGHC